MFVQAEQGREEKTFLLFTHRISHAVQICPSTFLLVDMSADYPILHNE